MSENFAESSSMAAHRSGSDIPSTPMSVDDNLSQATSDTTEDAPILSHQQSMMSTDTESFFAPPNATTRQKRRESWTSKNHWAKRSTRNMIDHLKNVHNITKESPAKGTSLVPHGLTHSAPALQDLKLPSDMMIKRHLTRYHGELMEKVKEKLRVVPCLAYTTDRWTTSNMKYLFLAIIAHWIDEDWVIPFIGHWV
ncbi:hypothetical protein BDA99DRAFT_566917 [Phascolomyces articulosus]|uniref:Uncharacterized protein n=1 Tax=Phascolomyces articulosus TaxID=60185 RepID=A0AAD5JKW3_9FUNG|nr:hypothetical protein BDA99DRAFT_566917 [Phascolomyces articulosus]